MSITGPRTPAIALLAAGLAAAALLTQCGCWDNSEGSSAPDRQAAPGAVPRQAPTQEQRDGELKQPLIRAIDDALDNIPEEDFKDVGMDEGAARTILEEADETLTRIKRENREGMRRVNNPPRRVAPALPPDEPKDGQAQPEQATPESPAADPTSPGD